MRGQVRIQRDRLIHFRRMLRYVLGILAGNKVVYHAGLLVWRRVRETGVESERMARGAVARVVDRRHRRVARTRCWTVAIDA